MESRKKELIAFVLFAAALLVFCSVTGAIVTPKKLDFGANIKSLQAEEKNSVDMVFMGSSMTYCDVVPEIIDEETGLNSYVLAGPVQTFPITYAYMEEMFKTQSPEIIFLEASGIIFDDYNDNFNKINILYMPPSINRIKLAFTQAKTSDLPEIFFPLYAYHSRWAELTYMDYLFGLKGYEKDSRKGYTYLSDIKPMEEITQYGDLEIAQNNAHWFAEFNELAEKNNARIVFFLVPRVNRMSGEIVDFVNESLADAGLSQLYDMNALFDEMKFDMENDFYDSRHLNYDGAVKFSKYLSGLINEGHFEN